jgi:hypothetical protein
VTEGTSTNLSVVVSGAGPFSYQWRFNGQHSAGRHFLDARVPGHSAESIWYLLSGGSQRGGAVFSSNVTVTVRRCR